MVQKKAVPWHLLTTSKNCWTLQLHFLSFIPCPFIMAILSVFQGTFSFYSPFYPIQQSIFPSLLRVYLKFVKTFLTFWDVTQQASDTLGHMWLLWACCVLLYSVIRKFIWYLVEHVQSGLLVISLFPVMFAEITLPLVAWILSRCRDQAAVYVVYPWYWWWECDSGFVTASPPMCTGVVNTSYCG